MPKKRKQKTPFEKCKSVLEDFLLNDPHIPLCQKNNTAYIDDAVVRHLLSTGHQDFLIKDISFGYQVGRASDSVLEAFAREERIFEGKAGRYKIEVVYGPFSERSYKAWPVIKSKSA
jgi:hypothetical protein